MNYPVKNDLKAQIKQGYGSFFCFVLAALWQRFGKK